MKAEKDKTVKVHPDLHRALKIHCAAVGEPLQDFANTVLNEALPKLYRVDFGKKKKK